MTSWADNLFAISVFTEDLPATRQFYVDVFELPVEFEDEDSACFRVGATIINVLRVSAAPELIEPAPVAGPDAGARAMYTISVPDVDAVCARLAERGVALLNGPVDRPWGPRTAAFRDPAGTVWEIATS